MRISLAGTKSSFLIVGVVASSVALVSTRVMADFAQDIEQHAFTSERVTYDNTAGLGPNGYPVVTVIASQPGSFGGHTFTGWAALAEDQTGSLDIFVSQSTLTNMTTSPSNDSATAPYGTPATGFAVGDEINVAGQWSPFDGIPEMAFSSVASSNNYIATVSSGNLSSVPTPPVMTIPGLMAGTGGGAGVLTNPAIAGVYLELQNVTITPGPANTGVNASVFPTYGQATGATETYEITDSGGNSMELFDWVTSYSTCAARGGQAVPTGPVNVYGFYDSFNEFVPIVIVPEPSTFMLAGLGLIGGLLAWRRRRS
jgi:hypothetical protein